MVSQLYISGFRLPLDTVLLIREPQNLSFAAGILHLSILPTLFYSVQLPFYGRPLAIQVFTLQNCIYGQCCRTLFE